MREIRELRCWLLNRNYPVQMVAKMTDEEVVAEYEAVTGESVNVQPIYY